MGKARQGGKNQEVLQALKNLYIHFPFCRSKCAYCALHSRAGASAERRREYVEEVVKAVNGSLELFAGKLATVYFGGGSPAFCELDGVFRALAGKIDSSTEFSVELHPLDVSENTLVSLKKGGINRISMGVQSLDDGILEKMSRGYGFFDAERAFALIKRHFDNAGIDLIVGYPGESSALGARHARLEKWALRHCSVYSLMVEEKTRLWRDVHRGALAVPDDDTVMDRLEEIASFLGGLGLERYEISNYAQAGFECRHNLAVWRGEDYVGIGEGAFGRMGRKRTQNYLFPGQIVEETTLDGDRMERAVFSLRTREGLDAGDFPQWTGPLDRFVAEGALEKSASAYRLTARGREICDTILAEIVASY